MTEPISVRVARAKGCVPQRLWTEEDGVPNASELPADHCFCEGAEHSGDPFAGQIDWLTPAASFALMQELAEGSWGEVGLYHSAGNKPWGIYLLGPQPQDAGAYYAAPTLAEAIALAWLSWQEVKG